MILGIDLGTSYACAGAFNAKSNSFQIVESMSRRKLLNYVTIKPNTAYEFGDLAKNKLRLNYMHSLYDAKILLGLQNENDLESLEWLRKLWPFKVEQQAAKDPIFGMKQNESKKRVRPILIKRLNMQ